MASKEQKTEAEKREGARELALVNLRDSTITDLASAYLIEDSGQYGESISSAIEQFKYLPAIQGEKGRKYITEQLLNSREDGKRYTGSVSEHKVINDCAKIVKESIGAIRIQDILDLVGSDKKVKEEYKEKYILDMLKSETKEEKEIVKEIIQNYMTFLLDTKISEALNQRKKAVVGDLEKILTEEPKPKEQPKKSK